ncbi:MAG: IS200/IS605 family accessory protein TnpB-related protein [Candidatus Peribacteraceae bacterium]|nr:IS200/IS605 family accessory protein TnpB-related protein [Candidatus Peribacteraceae bacterium]
MNDLITIKGRLLDVSDAEKVNLLNLMRVFCNSKRYAFNRITKDKIKILDLEKDCYSKFIPNGRYSKDSVYLARAMISAHKEHLKLTKQVYIDRIKKLQVKADKIKDPHKKHLVLNKLTKFETKLAKVVGQIKSGDVKGIIFGGKKNWQLMVDGKLSKSDWKQLRNNELYSRAEKSHKGNVNLRLIEKEGRLYLRISDPINNEKYHLRLYVPQKKFQYLDFSKHTVQVKYKNNHFDVHISSHITSNPVYALKNGAIGIDINPKSINASIVSKEGNYLGSRKFNIAETLNTSTNKTRHLLGNTIKKLVKLAKWQNKGIVIEDLKFKDKIKYTKLNRLLKAFAYSKIIELFQLRCLKEKVELKMVNPAFSSFIGFAKYALKYNMSTHNAAAFVVGRRGLMFKERLSSEYECLVNPLEGRSKSGWNLWSDLSKKLTALRVYTIPSLRALKTALDAGEIPALKKVTPGSFRISNNQKEVLVA